MENLTAAVKNATNSTAVKDTPEGLFCAYFALFTLAVVPIYIGSIKSIKTYFDQKTSGEEADKISQKDAMMFPLIASCALFGIFLVFKIFGKEYINKVLQFYFFVIGVLALARMLNPLIKPYLPEQFFKKQYKFLFTEEPKPSSEETKKEESTTEASNQVETIFKLDFEGRDFITLLVALGVGAWYLYKKHWLANNLFGLAFALNAIEIIQLNKVKTGCILLSGLFIYDIFWVFGTNVMVSVAKQFDAPIKLVFPRNIIADGLGSTNLAMLGLGDIVVPGIFIALLLRFDTHLKPGSRTYFHSGMFAYILGLATTMIVMHVFKHAQPALLYLVPTCLGIPLLLAVLKGELGAMMSYEDHPELEAEVEPKKVK